jgi:hypothetical protein
LKVFAVTLLKSDPAVAFLLGVLWTTEFFFRYHWEIHNVESFAIAGCGAVFSQVFAPLEVLHMGLGMAPQGAIAMAFCMASVAAFICAIKLCLLIIVCWRPWTTLKAPQHSALVGHYMPDINKFHLRLYPTRLLLQECLELGRQDKSHARSSRRPKGQRCPAHRSRRQW